MSGHSVFTPVIDPVSIMPALSNVAAGGAALGAAAAMAMGVRKIIQNRLDTAKCRMTEARNRAHAWLALQQEMVKEMSWLRKAENMLVDAERHLAAMQLGGARALSTEGAGDGPPGQTKHRYLSLGRKKVSREEILALLKEIAATVEAFPAELQEAANSPVRNLREQVASVLDRFQRGDEVAQHEAASFKSMVSTTLSCYLKEVEGERKLKEELQRRAEAAFDEILLYQELAYEMPAQYKALDVLRDQLIALFESGDFTRDRMEVVEKRIKTLKEEIDKKIVFTSYRQGLCESVMRNLADMGYEATTPFPAGEEGMIKALMKIPGGERVEIALHANNQIAFQLQHERYTESGDLSKSELDHMRGQEKRWCQDLKELVRRLVGEGFDYKVSFEDAIPDESIKVVVVETPEEVEQEARAAEKKYMRQE